MLVGRPVGKNIAAEAVAWAHRVWDGGRDDLDAAIEGCAAAICAGDDAELALWQQRARRKVSLDWVEPYEETLFLMDARATNISLSPLATSTARVLADAIQTVTVSPASLVVALWRCVGGRAPLGALLAGRAREVDELVFGPKGEDARLKIGKVSHEVTSTEEGPTLVLSLKVTGRGPLSPGGYAIDPFTYQLPTVMDRVGLRLSRLAEPERTQKLAMFDEALARRDHAVTLRVQIGRHVELSPDDAGAFKARIEHSWEHARLSMRCVRAEARVEVTR